MNKCDYCICKTCAIAQINGGAEGCGDCNSCKEHEYYLFVNACNEYYSPEKKKEES